MNDEILHGIEVELQLMVETEDGLSVVSAEHYLQNQHNLLPSNVDFDFGNIEIRTSPLDSYEEAVKSANDILYNKLIPCLINIFKLEKFALFLPTPMCRIYYNEEPVYRIINKRRVFHKMKVEIVKPNDEVCCLKHWNISLPMNDAFANLDFWEDYVTGKIGLSACYEKLTSHWKYDYKSLIEKGYGVELKDLDLPNFSSRVHIKIPYHYAPLNGNPDLLPNFEDIIIPPKHGWKNLVCYYKDNTFTKVRDLI